jgi:DNA-binding NarL/FixJ family response regulator
MTSTPQIRVFLVDDHKVVIEGMEMLLSNTPDIIPVGFAQSGEDAVVALEAYRADVVLLDINLPGMNGIDTCKVLREKYPDVKIIALSMLQESSLIKLMLKSGAHGYLLKNAGKDEVVAGIRRVHAGERFLGDEVNSIILDSLTHPGKSRTPGPTASLSRREKEVLALIVQEFTTQEIADKLFISFGTVETHRRNLLIKLGARNTAGLVRLALEYNLVD